LCFGVVNRSGAVYFDLTTFARYFTRYRLCVTAPSGVESCRSFTVRRAGQFYGSSVQWYRNFPNGGPGAYDVRWKLGPSPLGPRLRFRLPLGG
jgi:hypothetical protein